MNTYLFLHIQTASKPLNYNLDTKTFEKWPRIATIGWSINHLFRLYTIRPVGFHIEPETSAYIGITNENAIQNGEYILNVLHELLNELSKVDYVIGHNIDYHLDVLLSELNRHKLDVPAVSVKKICLMKSAVNWCKIPSNSGYKFPSLQELYSFIFCKDLSEKYVKSPFNNYPPMAFANIFAIKECFYFMYETSLFTKQNLIPNIKFFSIPFKNNDIKHTKTLSQIDSNLYMGGVILFENIISIEEVENYGLYILSRKKAKTEIEYILIDYRGVLIHKSDIKISVGFHIGMEVNGIFLEQFLLYYISFTSFGIIVHEYDDLTLIGQNYIVSDFFGNKSILNNKGELQIENCKILNNLKVDYFVAKFDSYCNVYDLDLKLQKTIALESFDITGISDNGDLYYISNGFMGLMELSGKILINPMFKYIEILNNDFILFSNQLKFQEGQATIDFMGIAKYDGEILLDEKYNQIDLVQNLPNIIKFTSETHSGIIDISTEKKFSIDAYSDFTQKNNLIYFNKVINFREFVGVLDEKCELLLPSIYESITYKKEYSDFLETHLEFEYLELTLDNKKQIYLLREKKLIEIWFDEFEFFNNCFLFYINGSVGLFDRFGNEIYNCIYFDIKFISDKLLILSHQTGYNIIDWETKDILFENVQRYFSIKKSKDLVLAIKSNGLIQYFNFDKTKTTDNIYSDINDIIDFKNHDRTFYLKFVSFNCGKLLVVRNGLFGYLDLDLKETINCQFTSATPFEDEGYCTVAINKQEYKLDQSGNLI